MRFFIVLMVATLIAGVAHAVPGERDRLNACKAMVQRAEAARIVPEPAELQKCRQIIREWTLRDSRMSVDDQGRPMR